MNPILSPPAPGPSTPIPVASFEGLRHGANGPITNLVTPPDVQLAVGPNHVFEMVNLIGRISTKTGVPVQTAALDTFFRAASTDFVSDPKIRYDTQSGRWFASLMDVTTSSVLLAVSRSADPTWLWNHYSFLASAGCADQPLLGMSDDKVVLSANDFSSCTASSPSYRGVEYWVINKTDLLAGTSARFIRFGPNVALRSVQPVSSLTPMTTQYLVTAGGGPTSTLTVLAVTGVPPGPVTVIPQVLSILTTAIPPNAPQTGTSRVLDTGYPRIEDAMWESNRLWLGLNDGCTPMGDSSVRSCVRLIEVDTANTTVLQDFDLGIPGKYAFYPALRTDGDGRLFVAFGYSSSGEFPGFMVAMRSSTDPPNQIGSPQLVRAGAGPEAVACDSSGVCRYGDYFGASRDPSDPSVVWVAGEYGTGSGWATFVAGMSATVRLTVSYSIEGGGSGYVPPDLTYVKDGMNSTVALSVTPTQYSVDAGASWSVTGILNGSTASERWATNETTWGNATASSSFAFVYSHQFLVSFGYRVTGGGVTHVPPSVFYQRFASVLSIAANATDWVDFGSAYGFPILLGGSNGSERWRADPLSVNGTVGNAGSFEVVYAHQAFVGFQVEGPVGSSVSPLSGWHDVGASITASVTAPVGWAAGEWIGVGMGAYSGASASPTIVVVGPFSETVILFAGLTIVAGSGGSVAFSYSGGAGTVASGTSRAIYVRPGTNVSITERPADPYAFKQWSGAASGTQKNLTLTIVGPTRLTADFALTQSAPSFSLYSAIGIMVVVLAVLMIVLMRRRKRREPPAIPPPPPP